MVDVTIPAGYGLVVLCNAVIPTLVMFFVLGSRVMGGRKKFGVPYPNMYATPGTSYKPGAAKLTIDQANAFNGLQRGHHNALETFQSFLVLSFVAGFVQPHVTAALGLVWSVARVSYALGYNGKGGRYAGAFKIGVLHFLALFAVVGMAGYQGVVWSGLL